MLHDNVLYKFNIDIDIDIDNHILLTESKRVGFTHLVLQTQ